MDYQDTGAALPSLRKVNVTWLDVNSRLGESNTPDLLPDVQAVNNSLYNLLSCPIGTRGPIFEPEYGTLLHTLLHDPLDYITAEKLRISFIQAIQRWEPRIVLDLDRSSVVPNFDRAAYVVTVYYTLVATATRGVAEFLINRQ